MPVVTTDPINQTVCSGDTTSFTIEATGATPMTFIWESSSDGTMWDTVFNGDMYAGATSDTLVVYSSLALNGMMYRGSAFNGDGADTSNSATLTVDTAFAGTISGTNPLCIGATAPFTSSVPGGVWSNADHTVDTFDASGVLAALSFGTDTVFYMATNTCGDATSWLEIRVDTAVSAMPVTGPSDVCVGNVITLSNVNVLGTGVWSTTTGNVSVSSAGVVTGVAGGIDTVTYAFTNGCSSVSSYAIVNIDTVITPGTISGPSEVCAGSWVSLTSSITGGIWLSGATSVAVVSSTGNVTGISQGTSLISYYQSNSCGASFASHSITVHVPAGPITGNDSVGIDSMLHLMNIATGGMWYSDDTTIAFADTMTGWVTGRATGVTTIHYDVTNICGTSSATTAMHVGPLPSAGTISGPDTVCAGSTITLTGSVAGGTWESVHPDSATIDMTTGVVTGVARGRDTIYHYVTNAFGTSRVRKNVYVHDAPEITFSGTTTFAMGASYRLDTVKPAGGVWSSSDPSTLLFISWDHFVPLKPGNATITYTATNTCGSTTRTFDITIPGATDVATVAGNNGNMVVYPNPTKGAISINLSTSTSEQVIVTLTNILGEKVKEFNITTNAKNDVIFDQPSGIYLLTAITADGVRHTARLSVTN